MNFISLERLRLEKDDIEQELENLPLDLSDCSIGDLAAVKDIAL